MPDKALNAMPNQLKLEFNIINDDLEIATPQLKTQVAFQLLSFSIEIDDFKTVLYFPNHWQGYDSWKEVLPPVCPILLSSRHLTES